MLHLTLTFSELDLARTVAENKAIYKQSTANAVVASTKSKNNLLDEYKQQNKVPQKVEEKEVFLDKAQTEKAVAEMVKAQIKDEQIAKMVIAFVNEKLDGACIYKKVK